MPDVTQTLSPTNGTDGRIRLTGNKNKVAGITKWDRDSKAEITKYLHFESPADSTTGLIQPLKGLGTGDNTVSIEGIYNTNATYATEGTTTGITNGANVTCDLYISKASTLGYPAVTGFISNFKTGSQIGPDAVKFTATLEVSGLWPAFGTIT